MNLIHLYFQFKVLIKMPGPPRFGQFGKLKIAREHLRLLASRIKAAMQEKTFEFSPSRRQVCEL